MWTVALNGGLTGLVGRLGLRVGGHLALSLHSSNEPGELLQWSRHDDSTINIVTGMLIFVLKTGYKVAPFSLHYCPEIPVLLHQIWNGYL